MSPVWIAWPKPGMCGNSWQVKSVKSVKSVKVSKLSPNYANVKKESRKTLHFCQCRQCRQCRQCWQWLNELNPRVATGAPCPICVFAVPKPGLSAPARFWDSRCGFDMIRPEVTRTSKSEVYPSTGGGCSIGCSPKRRGHMIPSSPCLCNHGLPRLQPEVRGHVPKKTWTRTPTDVHF